MKILLRNSKTGLYLGGSGNWTLSPKRALAFADEQRATDYMIYRRLSDTHVAVLPGIIAPETRTAPSAAIHNINQPQEPVRIAMKKPNPIEKQRKANMNLHKSTNGSAPTGQSTGTAVRPPRSKATSARRQSAPISVPIEQTTMVQARIDVGLGNALFVRGQGDGLSWEKGLPLTCIDSTTWVWSTTRATDRVVFKLLLNDQVWAKGEDVVVEAGKVVELVPAFLPHE